MNIGELVYCPGCEKDKEASDFRKCSSHANGLATYCKVCWDEKYPNKRYYVPKPPREKVEADPAVVARAAKDRMLKHRYGIRLADYERMYAEQDGKCAVCKLPAVPSKLSPSGNLYVDHCHSTNKVRGLLCHRCNIALGHIEQPELLAEALRYLARSISPSVHSG